MTGQHDALFSVLVTTMFATLLVVAGGPGIAMAVALVGCGLYRARCAVVRPAHRHRRAGRLPALHA